MLVILPNAVIEAFDVAVGTAEPGMSPVTFTSGRFPSACKLPENAPVARHDRVLSVTWLIDAADEDRAALRSLAAFELARPSSVPMLPPAKIEPAFSPGSRNLGDLAADGRRADRAGLRLERQGAGQRRPSH